MNSKTRIGVLATIFIVVCVCVFGGIFLTRNIGKSEKVVSQESAENKLDKMFKKVNPGVGNPVKSPVESMPSEVVAEELPDIDTCDVTVTPTTEFYAEIYSSPEKSGSGTDGWLTEIAEAYNTEQREVNGQRASIKLRTVNSGQGVDYIVTKKAIPDGFAPSSMLWAEMLNARGVDYQVVSESMIGNVAGIVFEKNKYKEFCEKNGSADVKSIIEAVESGDIVVGYTNPNASTAGMNFLITTLHRYDLDNPLSDAAAAGFASFQKNVPFVALTTIQMRDAAEKGSLDAFVMEYQSYVNDKTLVKNYEFVPYGYRHDNPLVTFNDVLDDKKAILDDFAEYCKSDKAVELAEQYGFNQLKDYICDIGDPDGQTLVQAQKLYKKNKDNGNPVVAVFVTDVSGSMSGDRISQLKASLINGMRYINSENYVGLVSYSHDVTIELDIGKFDLNQQALFKGAVENLDPVGSTAIYDGLIVGAHMLHDFLKDHPDAKPMLFLLSDGDNVDGYSFRDVSGVIEGLKYPVYTIGYAANVSVLSQISAINEAAMITAETDDIVYQLRMLFEANM